MAAIPDNAKKVFEGIIFDVYHWQQKLFDGTSSTFERLKRVDTVGVFPITSNNKIILSEQEQPDVGSFFGSLGGRVDRGEDPLAAAKRELLEESGYEAKTWELWFHIDPWNKIEWNIYNYIAKDLVKVSEPNLDAGEKIKLVEVSFDEFIELMKDENYRDFEIAIKMLRAIHDPEELAKIKKLLSSK